LKFYFFTFICLILNLQGCKPPSTISLLQETANLIGEKVTLKAKGRHDPCVVNRAVPIVEAMAALVLLDCYMIQQARISDKK
jgi:chorismate synthase